jgi:hypothetical protein
MDEYKIGLRLWDPLRDVKSFKELRGMGQLTLSKWIGSILHRQTFPYFSWSDPMPAIARALKPLRKKFKRKPIRTPAPKATGQGALA